MTPEGLLLRSILDYLAAIRVFALRMQVGAVKTDARFIRYGVPGMADVLAFPVKHGLPYPVWLEAKVPKGRQSELQKSFQWKVEQEGHLYAVVRSIEDVQKAIRL